MGYLFLKDSLNPIYKTETSNELYLSTGTTSVDFNEAGTYYWSGYTNNEYGFVFETWASGGYNTSRTTQGVTAGRYGGDYLQTKLTGQTLMEFSIEVGRNDTTATAQWGSRVLRTGTTLGSDAYCEVRNGALSDWDLSNLLPNVEPLINTRGGIGTPGSTGTPGLYQGGAGGGGAGPDGDGAISTGSPIVGGLGGYYNADIIPGHTRNNGGGGGWQTETLSDMPDYTYIDNPKAPISPGGGASGIGKNGLNAATAPEQFGGSAKVRITYKV